MPHVPVRQRQSGVLPGEGRPAPHTPGDIYEQKMGVVRATEAALRALRSRLRSDLVEGGP